MLFAPLLLLSAIGSTLAQSYAPSIATCPPNSTVRNAGNPSANNQTLNPQEAAYIESRRANLPAALMAYLGSLNASLIYGGDVSELATMGIAPKVAISLSGGGNRASLFGAGALRAFDAREGGPLSGILQLSSYITALSGGSWALTSFIFNDMPTPIRSLVLGNGTASNTGWNLDFDVFNPSEDATIQANYVAQIMADLAAKKAAGFNVTLSDYWTRALSHNFLPGTTASNFFDNTTAGNHGASITFSSTKQLSSWKSGMLPFPIIVANVITNSAVRSDVVRGNSVPLSNVVYEFSPVEFGSFDPELASFIPMEVLGTTFNGAGAPASDSACAVGFDNAGFVFGASSNIFNAYNITRAIAWTLPLSPINQAWTLINRTFFDTQPNQQMDVTAVPNPFLGLNAATYEDTASTQLRLVDGGLTGAVSPLSPLAVAARDVDLIVVVDSTADSLTFTPQGSSLVISQTQAGILGRGVARLPPLPSSNTTFINQGLNIRATFFGCAGTPAKLNGVKNMTNPYPMIAYIPNYLPGVNTTNNPTSKLVYTSAEASAFLDTAYSIVNRGYPSTNSTTRDDSFPLCMACTVVERARGATGVDRTPACDACFSRYCWNEQETSVMNGTASTGAGAGGVGAGTGSTGSTGAVTQPRSGAISLAFGGAWTGILALGLGLILL